MSQIFRAAMALGPGGLIPFVWGAITVLQPGLADWTNHGIAAGFAKPDIMLVCGALFLVFIPGALWDFATNLKGPGLSPMAGFTGLSSVDRRFWRSDGAPDRWLCLPCLATRGFA